MRKLAFIVGILLLISCKSSNLNSTPDSFFEINNGEKVSVDTDLIGQQFKVHKKKMHLGMRDRFEEGMLVTVISESISQFGNKMVLVADMRGNTVLKNEFTPKDLGLFDLEAYENILAEIKSKQYCETEQQLLKALNDEAVIGMSKKCAVFAWGKPISSNSVMSNNDVSEQWEYSNGYLYFVSGVLSTIQK